MTRAEIATLANKTDAAGAPTLFSDSTREGLIRWLQTNDPNGVHTDELCAIEDIDPYTLETAWDAVAAMCDDS